MSVKLNRLFDYPEISRITNEDGTRFYMDPTDGTPLPSVTTILSGTSDKTQNKLWEERVGKAKADQVRKEATGLGTLMHTHIENYVMGIPRPGGNNLVRLQAARMADQIINKGLPRVDEVWGQEVAMYFPGLYGGMTDLVGVHDGIPSIMDHKTAKKMRTRDMIVDYFDQMCAYSLAHNEVYGTDIKRGVIFMVSRELDYKEFILEGLEFDKHMDSFLNRVDAYLKAAA
jgi:genome maintenance exonuclease 1